MLTLRDPADETNDLGRKAIAWKHVQKTYGSLADRLATDLKQNHRPSLLAWHVGPIYAMQQVHRKRLTAYGKSVAAEGRKDPSIGDDISTRFHKLDLKKEDVSTQTEDLSAELEDAYQKRITDLSTLRSIAQAIREGRAANDQSAREAEGLDMAREAAKGEQDDVTPWLRDVVGESEHKETGEALSNIMGLDKKREAK
jgi:non-canonical poly(A) RNA polymerase PAPD5/7